MKNLMIFLLVLCISVVVLGDDYKTTKEGYLAAATKEYYDQMMNLIAVKDYEALQTLIDAGVVISLKAGLKVQIVDSTWTGAIKIRLKGSTTTVWTVMEAVK